MGLVAHLALLLFSWIFGVGRDRDVVWIGVEVLFGVAFCVDLTGFCWTEELLDVVEGEDEPPVYILLVSNDGSL